MVVVSVISEIFNYIFQGLMFVIVYNIFLSPRFNKIATSVFVFIFSLLIIGTAIASSFYSSDNLFNSLKIFFYLLIVFIAYKDKPVKKLLVYFGWAIVSIATESVAIILISLLNNDYYKYHMSIKPFDYNNPNYKYRIICIILVTVLCALDYIVVLIIKNRKNIFKKYSVNAKQLSKYAICFIFQVSALVLLGSTKLNSSESIDIILVFFFIIVTVALNLILFKTLLEITEKNKKIEQAKLIESQIKGQYDYYKMLCKQVQYVRKLRHDISNNLQVINSLLDNRENEEATEYAKKVNKQFEKSYLPVITENLILDTLFFNKTEIAKERGINLNIKCSTKDFGNIKDEDLISVVSNILDNCLENSNSDISVSIAKVSGMLLIKSENKIEQVEKHKSKDYGHGLGMQIIKDICEKYDGCFEHSAENDTFIAAASLKAV